MASQSRKKVAKTAAFDTIFLPASVQVNGKWALQVVVVFASRKAGLSYGVATGQARAG